MSRLNRTAVAATVVVLGLGMGVPARATGQTPSGVLPLPGPVSRAYDAPEPDWRPGHRGVDLTGVAGDEARAALGGTVSFVGSIAGVPIVVVSHGETRTTYEPVDAAVRTGDAVATGAVIGRLQSGHPGCAASACLHWGLKRGDAYLNPLTLIRQAQARLIAELPPPPAVGHSGGPLHRPPGPITSGFGMRLHPVVGRYVLHDGTDFGLGCGTPLATAGGGTVIRAGDYGGYGTTVEVDHGMIDGKHVVTLYGHLSAMAVTVGSTVAAGDIIGLVGTTGWSTGCHLHFGVYLDGVAVDPLTVTS